MTAPNESTIDDPAAPSPRGLDFDATSAAVLGGLFGRVKRPRIGRYEVVRSLGSGAMGRVFAARDTKLDRDVALKLLHVERGGSNDARGRFLREAQALARVSHPNVVEVYEVGVHEGDVYIAMELLRGQTLQAWCDAQPRGWKAILTVLVQMVEGLAAAHRTGLVHRDVKPANVWVGAQGRVRLIDFGLALGGSNEVSELNRSSPEIAEAFSAASSRLTRTGAMVGSPAYMAPEQLRQGRASEASDQFSYCVAAYEVLHGRRPFSGKTPMQLLDAIERGSIERTQSDVPSWLDEILARGLEADPRRRWPSVQALARALARGPRRRRTAGAAVAIAIAVAGAWTLRPSPTGCDQQSLRSWNPQVREAISSSVGAPASTFDRDIVAPVQRWVHAWSEQHRVTCETGPSDAAFDRTMHCLGVSRGRFAETIEVMRALEPGRVDEAIRVAAGVRDIPTCDTLEADTASDEALLAVSRVASLHNAGLYDDAITEATAALNDVTNPAVRIELHEYAASAARYASRNADAVSLGEAGYFLALREADDTRAAALAAVITAALGGMGELRAAQQWYARGVAIADRTEDPIEARHALDSGLAVSLYHAGRAAEAVEVYDRMLATIPADDPTRISALHGDRGNALLDMGRLDEGRAALSRALEALIRSHGPDHSAVALAQSNLGTAFAMSGDLGQARPHFVEALRIARSLDDESQLGMALGNMGLVEHATGHYDAALPYLEQALELFETIGGPDSPQVLSTLNHLAMNAQARGDDEGAQRQLWSLLERTRAERGPDHIAVGRAQQTLGENYVRRGLFAEAEPHFRDALRIFEATRGSEHPDLIYALVGLGRALSGQARHDEAMAILRQALDLAERDGVEPSLLHEARLGMARAMRDSGDHSGARSQLKAARAVALTREDAGAVDEVDALLTPAATRAG